MMYKETNSSKVKSDGESKTLFLGKKEWAEFNDGQQTKVDSTFCFISSLFPSGFHDRADFKQRLLVRENKDFVSWLQDRSSTRDDKIIIPV